MLQSQCWQVPQVWSAQSAQAAAHGMHREDSPMDIVLFGLIGFALLMLLPAKQQFADGAPVSEPRFAER